MKILFVDDMPERFDRFVETHPDDEITWIDNVNGACTAVLNMDFDQVWLDHDQDGGESFCSLPDKVKYVWVTFFPVACVLGAMKFRGSVFLHTANPDGRDAMARVLTNAGVKVSTPDGFVLTGLWGGAD